MYKWLQGQEWYVVAAVFTLHVILAMVFFSLWVVLSAIIFFGIAWVAALL